MVWLGVTPEWNLIPLSEKFGMIVVLAGNA